MDVGGRVAFYFCEVFGGVRFFSRLHFGIAGSPVVAREVFFFLGDVGVGVGDARSFVLILGSLVPA